jgi:peptidylprolyl isomerase
MVIKGWDQGLVGIKPGGRRQLTIPAKLAYGPQGQPPSIPPNSTLVFIVDALKVSGK